MWQEIIVFALAAGAFGFLVRMFFRGTGDKAAGCGCGGCSSCPADPDLDFFKAAK
jgi:hypothetical protein